MVINMTNVLTKTIEITVVNLGTYQSLDLSLPLEENELQKRLQAFNPNGNCLEVQALQLIHPSLTDEHKKALSGVINEPMLVLNKLASLLTVETDFDIAFLYEACDEAKYAIEAFETGEYTVYRNIENDEQMGHRLAELGGFLKDTDNHKTLRDYFDAERYGRDEVITQGIILLNSNNAVKLAHAF